MTITVNNIQYSIEFEHVLNITTGKKDPPVCKISVYKLPEDTLVPPFISLKGEAKFHDKGKPDFVEARKAAFTKAISVLPQNLRKSFWEVYKQKFRYITSVKNNKKIVYKGTGQPLVYLYNNLTYKAYFKREINSVKTICVIDAFDPDNNVVFFNTGLSVCKVSKGDTFNAIDGRYRAFRKALHKTFPLNSNTVDGAVAREVFWEIFLSSTRSYKSWTTQLFLF